MFFRFMVEKYWYFFLDCSCLLHHLLLPSYSWVLLHHFLLPSYLWVLLHHLLLPSHSWVLRSSFSLLSLQRFYSGLFELIYSPFRLVTQELQQRLFANQKIQSFWARRWFIRSYYLTELWKYLYLVRFHRFFFFLDLNQSVCSQLVTTTQVYCF